MLVAENLFVGIGRHKTFLDGEDVLPDLTEVRSCITRKGGVLFQHKFVGALDMFVDEMRVLFWRQHACLDQGQWSLPIVAL